MKHISVLIKPASSACNLRCEYCFYADVSEKRACTSFGKMNIEVMESMLDHVFMDLEAYDHVTFNFQGGEPTLAGLDYFKAFTSYVAHKQDRQVVHYGIQTNGTLLDDQWCKLFKEHKFLVGLSMDGGKDSHDQYRKDARKQGTYTRVMAAKKRLDAHAIEYNVLCVLTNPLARHPRQVFNFLLEHQIRYIQFIPCLNELDSPDRSVYALTPERFASFYKGLYPLWEQECRKGNYLHVSFFDHHLQLFANGTVGTCGMIGQCQLQYVIEADGSVYPCDFFVLDEWCIGNITEHRLSELARSQQAGCFIQDKPPLSKYCTACTHKEMCNGGCKRMKEACYVNDKESYCGYQDFLDQYLARLLRLVGA